MQTLQMFLCDDCGYSRQNAGLCPYCRVPLTLYTKESQREYQVDLEDAMRVMSEYQWYI